MKLIPLLMVFVLLHSYSDFFAQNANTSSNPLLEEWSGPFGGVPAFELATPALVKDAMIKGMAMGLKEYDVIASNPEPATFQNTIVPLQNVAKALQRVQVYYGVMGTSLSTPEYRDVQKEISPLLSEYGSKINQNEKLFARIKKVYDDAQSQPLPAEEQHLIEELYTNYRMQGAHLDAATKQKYADIQKKLSSLYTKFSNNILAEEEGYVTFFTKEESAGLPESYLTAAAKAAADRGKPGFFAVTNTRSSMDPFLTFADNRSLRSVVWRNYYQRGNNDNEFDNKALIQEILTLRRDKVALLGNENYAEWRLQDRMAKTPETAFDLMKQVWAVSTRRVKEEVADMQKLADKDGITIEPWDYRFYAEKVRKMRYDLDSEEVRAYLQLDKLQEAMFFVAGELFNFKFTALPKGQVSVFHEDVSVYEVTDKTTGKHVGVWYLDPYARPGKRSGAWATGYRTRQNIDKEISVICSNNSNFIKPAPGEPLLITWDDANTFFHEFGHALHGFSATIKYPGSDNGVRDYTEFHSQLLERWLTTDPVIDNYFLHYKTGKKMPKDLVEKIKKSATFNQGFFTTEFLGSALMDMYYHTTPPKNIEVNAFEKHILDSLGMPKELTMRHRSTHFTHIFSGEGYSAGYYGYLWADVLTADAQDLFSKAPGGFYDKELAAKMVKYLFSPRGSIDPAEAYRKFSGRDPSIDGLLKDRGLN